MRNLCAGMPTEWLFVAIEMLTASSKGTLLAVDEHYVLVWSNSWECCGRIEMEKYMKRELDCWKILYKERMVIVTNQVKKRIDHFYWSIISKTLVCCLSKSTKPFPYVTPRSSMSISLLSSKRRQIEEMGYFRTMTATELRSGLTNRHFWVWWWKRQKFVCPSNPNRKPLP